MPSANGKSSPHKLRWSAGAQKSLYGTMTHIDSQDVSVSALVLQRLQQALDLIAERPGIGTPTGRKNHYRFAIPKTGHIVEYLLSDSEVIITRWARHSRLK